MIIRTDTAERRRELDARVRCAGEPVGRLAVLERLGVVPEQEAPSVGDNELIAGGLNTAGREDASDPDLIVSRKLKGREKAGVGRVSETGSWDGDRGWEAPDVLHEA